MQALLTPKAGIVAFIALIWAVTCFADDRVIVLNPIRISTSSTVTVSPATGSTTTVQGTDAHDAVITGKPVLFGGYASDNEPAEVSADGDVVRPWFTQDGRQIVLVGHGNPETPDWTNCTASGDTVLISSPGASVSIYVNKVTIHNAGSANRLVSLRAGAGGTVVWQGELAAEGGAAGISFGSRGWKLAANTNLIATLDSSGDVDINVTEFYLAP